MWVACQLDVGVFDNTTRFCSLFNEDRANVMEYYEDLDNYWTTAYGYGVCPFSLSLTLVLSASGSTTHIFTTNRYKLANCCTSVQGGLHHVKSVSNSLQTCSSLLLWTQ